MSEDKALEIKKMANECPYYKLLGMVVEEIVEGSAKICMDVKKEHLQMFGAAHGGSIISLADSAAAIAAMYMYYPKMVSTIEIKTNIIGRALEGEKLIAIGKVIHKGKSTVVSESEVRTQDGRLIAKSLATFFVSG